MSVVYVLWGLGFWLSGAIFAERRKYFVAVACLLIGSVLVMGGPMLAKMS